MLLTVEREHPALDGHFPDRPIVPAVVILNLVIQHVEAAHPQQRVAGVRRIKWLQPLCPDQVFELTLDAPNLDSSNKGYVRFCCRLQDAVMAEGSLLLQGNC